jgi:uncharacterized protein (TIGR00661 family)
MTQALSLKAILEAAGHRVVAAFMGESAHRPIPQFFLRGFEAPVHTYVAPAFVLDRRRKGVRPISSFLRAVTQIPRYWSHGPELHGDLSAHAPDLIVNFYDLLGGLYTTLFRPNVPVVSVGHQFLFFHPEFPTPRGERLHVAIVRQHTRMSSPHSDLRLGLSFTPMRDVPEHRVRVVPPLLRETLLRSEPERGSHILAYILNPGYGEDLQRWHEAHPSQVLHCFWDKPDAPPRFSPREGLTFHRLAEDEFLNLLATCRAFTSTAGFESVCEAAFLAKPIMLVPTEGHVEQQCNAMDAERAGLAIWRREFDLTEFLQGVDAWDFQGLQAFREWVREAPEMYLRLLEGVAAGKNPMRIPLPEIPRKPARRL